MEANVEYEREQPYYFVPLPPLGGNSMGAPIRLPEPVQLASSFFTGQWPFFPALRDFLNRHNLGPMNLTKERSRAEIILFASVIFGIWLSIWAVILVSATLGVVAGLFTLIPLIIFALRDHE